MTHFKAALMYISLRKKKLHYYPSSVITHKNLSTTPFITCNTCYSFSCYKYLCFQVKLRWSSLGRVLIPFPHEANHIYIPIYIYTVHSAIQQDPVYKLKYCATRVGRQQVMIWSVYSRTQYTYVTCITGFEFY